ncbi:MAG: ribosomal protein S18-alanine N-acetyltransferase [Lentilitoribacter sp.]
MPLGNLFSSKPELEVLKLANDQSYSVAELHTLLFKRGWDEVECSSLLAQNNVFGFYARPIDRKNLHGFVLSRVVADEAEILSIGTDESLQKQGIGWRLMQAAIGEASQRGAEKMFLEVEENNIPAVKLYQKIGFQTVGERKAYYDNGGETRSNALVLELKLH